ncbi:SDR family oxidoreductase [uncultured Erythrobacter sp.]|uniref:SDR family oxidoreductase n=1 Tax=uncultured Erythrobacter sp. TaxID=263913 RepID=UPI002632D94C|nr:SDR family oxidoreductase [uncultured Erythrobacter sp.]
MTRRTFITGGSKGIGSAIVKRLAADGHEVVFSYNSSAHQADALCAIDREKVSCIGLDLQDPTSVETMRDYLDGDHEPFDGFIHCAGTTYDRLSMSGERGAILKLMETNLFSMMGIYSLLLPAMMRNRFGRIICLGSVTAKLGNTGNAFYASSKAAMGGFLRSSVAEIASRGITLNLIAPGFIATDMIRDYPGLESAAKKRIPAKRVGKPEDVAALASFLMREEAGYINGATLTVDGGLSATLGWSAA